MLSSRLPPPDDLCTLAEAARLVPKGATAATLFRWVRSGDLNGWKVRGVWMVSRAEVLSLQGKERGG